MLGFVVGATERFLALFARIGCDCCGIFLHGQNLDLNNISVLVLERLVCNVPEDGFGKRRAGAQQSLVKIRRVVRDKDELQCLAVLSRATSSIATRVFSATTISCISDLKSNHRHFDYIIAVERSGFNHLVSTLVPDLLLRCNVLFNSHTVYVCV